MLVTKIEKSLKIREVAVGCLLDIEGAFGCICNTAFKEGVKGVLYLLLESMVVDELLKKFSKYGFDMLCR